MKSFEYYLKIVESKNINLPKNAENILSLFPDNTTSWKYATDEIRDIARTAKEMYNEFDLDVSNDSKDAYPAFNFRNIDNPSEWNTKGKEYIRQVYNLMSTKTKKIFLNEFQHYFNKNNAKKLNYYNESKSNTILEDIKGIDRVQVLVFKHDKDFPLILNILKNANIDYKIEKTLDNALMVKLIDLKQTLKLLINFEQDDEMYESILSIGGTIPNEDKWKTLKDKEIKDLTYTAIPFGDKLFKVNDIEFFKSNIGKSIRFKYDSSLAIPMTIQPKLMIVNENNTNDTHINDIKKIVNDNSYFEFDQEDNNELIFSTRENGDISSEKYCQKDLEEGKKIKQLLLDKYPNIEIKLEPVDEWVILTINLNQVIEEFYYTFKKHSLRDPDDTNSRGFGETCKTKNDLINLIKRFTPNVKYKKYINEVDNLPFNKKSFSSGKETKWVLISNKDENDSNYYFSIRKNIK